MIRQGCQSGSNNEATSAALALYHPKHRHGNVLREHLEPTSTTTRLRSAQRAVPASLVWSVDLIGDQHVRQHPSQGGLAVRAPLRVNRSSGASEHTPLSGDQNARHGDEPPPARSGKSSHLTEEEALRRERRHCARDWRAVSCPRDDAAAGRRQPGRTQSQGQMVELVDDHEMCALPASPMAQHQRSSPRTRISWVIALMNAAPPHVLVTPLSSFGSDIPILGRLHWQPHARDLAQQPQPDGFLEGARMGSGHTSRQEGNRYERRSE